MKAGSKFCSVCGSVAVGAGQVGSPTTMTSQPTYQTTVPQVPAFTPTSPFQPGPVQRTNGLAIASICLSCTCFCGPAGLITGIIALSQINKNIDQKGKELAIAGIIVGSLGTLYWTFWLFSSLFVNSYY
jgi:hypothetical protein